MFGKYEALDGSSRDPKVMSDSTRGAVDWRRVGFTVFRYDIYDEGWYTP